MNVNYKHKDSKKGLYFLVLFLVLSLIFNGVTLKNLYTGEKKNEDVINEKISEKDSEIDRLEASVTSLKNQLSNLNEEDKQKLSNTELDKQKAYKSVADEFIAAYLNYDSNSLEERREKIKVITSEELLDKIAPETDSNSENELSSDPTFTSKIKESKVYISELSNDLNKAEIVADVSYLAKSTEGETTVKSFILLELTKDEDGVIRINNYTYYPMK